MSITNSRRLIRPLTVDDAELLLDYNRQNKSHLAPWEPARDELYYTLTSTRERLKIWELEHSNRSALRLAAFEQNEAAIVALCNFTNIVYGPFQACHLGYSIAQQHQGKGMMFEVLESAIEHVFNELKLHRIMANYILTNHKSAVLLTKLGFEKEGLAKSYLKIAGQWQDHVLTAKLNPNSDVF